MPWKFIAKENISHKTFDEIFRLYYTTYTQARETIWFNTVDELYEYPMDCAYYYVSNEEKLICGMLFRKLPMVNKISLLYHDGTEKAKKLLMDELARLLVSEGYVIEASGAVSWILRSRYHLMPIVDVAYIATALDIESKGDIIQMNLDYDINDKDSYVYVKQTGGYTLYESLFGRMYDKKPTNASGICIRNYAQ